MVTTTAKKDSKMSDRQFTKIAGTLKNNKNIVTDFNGGKITSNAGMLLLAAADKKFRTIEKMAACFTDHRKSQRVEHPVLDMLRQRIYSICCGHEDLNDHDDLCGDPAFAAALQKPDISGKNRKHQRYRGKPLASKCSLNRLELSDPEGHGNDRYKRICADFEKLETLPMELFIERMTTEPSKLIIDFDATDFILHGNQEGKFFHGYYDNYCYLPLYAFIGKHLVLAKLRPSNIDAAKGTTEALEWMVPMIREKFPNTRIILRGDSGFCREKIMSWCEENGVEYILGLAKNSRLIAISQWSLELAAIVCEMTGERQRIFSEFYYSTKDSWSRERRVIAKAEHTQKGSNPRFIVTNCAEQDRECSQIYDFIYCARGEMENRIHEQMSLFADRSSSSKFHANQLRMWFSAFAYILLNDIREVGLKNTMKSNYHCSTIALKFLKIGALVRESTRRVLISMSSSYPEKATFNRILVKLQE